MVMRLVGSVTVCVPIEQDEPLDNESKGADGAFMYEGKEEDVKVLARDFSCEEDVTRNIGDAVILRSLMFTYEDEFDRFKIVTEVEAVDGQLSNIETRIEGKGTIKCEDIGAEVFGAFD